MCAASASVSGHRLFFNRRVTCMAAWAMGRLLGPQLMVAGGGHPTHQWFGMYYSGQVGRRIPVPLIQATEDFCVYLVLIAIERHLNEEKLRLERDRLRLVLEITNSLSSRLDLRRLFEVLSSSLLGVTRCDFLCFASARC